jgi:hypothetical protein
VNVGDERDGESVEPGGPAGDGQFVSFDAEGAELGDAGAGQGEAGDGRNGQRGGGQEAAAGNGPI